MTKKLMKSATDKKIAGVCGGVAAYLNVDSTLVRLIFVLLVFGLGTGVFAYIVAAFIMPEDTTHDPYRTQNNRQDVTPNR